MGSRLDNEYFANIFWPQPPHDISNETKAAMDADLKAKRFMDAVPYDVNRQRVDVWIRHSDNQARKANREWLKSHAVKYARRWAVVSTIAWMGSWLCAGQLILEVPLTLLGVVAVVIAIGFLYASRALNSEVD
jgi:hypothetical protein